MGILGDNHAMSEHTPDSPAPSLAKSDQNLVWIDCEMTGLDPEVERLIEIAVVITGPQLHPRIEGPVLVVHQSEALLDRNDEVGSSILLLSTKTHKKASITAGFFHERRFFNCRIWHPWLGASSCRVGRTPCQRLGQHDRGGRPPRQPPWGHGCFGH